MSPSDQSDADYLEVLRTAIEALSNPPLPFCLIGALALGAHGKPRATYDIDLLILADRGRANHMLLLRVGMASRFHKDGWRPIRWPEK